MGLNKASVKSLNLQHDQKPADYYSAKRRSVQVEDRARGQDTFITGKSYWSSLLYNIASSERPKQIQIKPIATDGKHSITI